MFSIYANDNLVYSDTYPNFNRKVSSPQFKMEVDAAGSLDFVLHVENSCYNTIQKMRTKIEVRRFDTPIWVGRVVEESIDFDNNKKLHCEGAFAFLNDTCQPIREFKNKTLSEIVTTILNTHNERYTSDIDKFRRVYFGGQSVIQADGNTERKIEYFATAYDYTIDAIKTILEKYECHCAIRMVYDEATGEWQNKLFLFKEYWDHSDQTIQFGKNLLDFTKKYNFSKIVTRLLPLAKTDRESPDEPVAVGTTLDLTQPLDYDPTTGYGILVTTSNNYVVDVARKTTCEPIQKNYEPDILQNTVTQNLQDQSYSYQRADGATTRIPYQHLRKPNTGRLNGKRLNLRRYLDTETNTYRYEPFTFIKMEDDGNLTVPSYVNIYPNSAFAGVLKADWNKVSESENEYIFAFYPWTKNTLYHRPAKLNDSLSDFVDIQNPDKMMKNYPYAATLFTDSSYNHTIDWAKPINYLYRRTDNKDITYVQDCYREIKDTLYELNQGCILPYRSFGINNRDVAYSERSTVTVIELDAAKYKYFYLSASQTGYRKFEQEAVYNPLVTIFKCKKNRNIWMDFKGYDDEGAPDGEHTHRHISYLDYSYGSSQSTTVQSFEESDALKGCEYWIWGNFSGDKCDLGILSDTDITRQAYNKNYLVLARVSVGRVVPINNSDQNACMSDDPNYSEGPNYYRGPFDWAAFYTEDNPDGELLHNCFAWNGPLMEDQASNIVTLDPDTYDFHKAIDNLSRCYEHKIDIGLSAQDLENYDRVLVVICSETPPSVNLITDEEAAQIITIGANTTSVPVDKQCPERYKYDSEGDWVRNTAVDINNIFDTTLGYGVMTPTDLGEVHASYWDYEHYNTFRLMNQSEYNYAKSLYESNPQTYPDVSLNIWENGQVNGIPHTESGAYNGNTVIKLASSNVDIETDKHWDKYRVTVYIVPASYEYTDASGNAIKEPSSVYLTTQMYGKSGTYAVFSMWRDNVDGSQDAGVWYNTNGPDHKRRLEILEYGKYINGITKYEKKKITMPFSKIQGAYCILVVGSYDTEPQLYMHDIAEQTKSSYITVSSVNNGDIYIDSRSNNLFRTDLEYGDIDIHTGLDSFIYETDRMRSIDDVVIPNDGFYNISTVSDDLIATIYIYRYNSTGTRYLYGVSTYTHFTDSTSIGYLHAGSVLRFVFRKQDSNFVELKDIEQFMLYILDNSVNVDKLVNAKVYVDNNAVIVDQQAVIPSGEPQDVTDVWDYRDRILVNPEPIEVSDQPKMVYINAILADYLRSTIVTEPSESYNTYMILCRLLTEGTYESDGVVNNIVYDTGDDQPFPVPDTRLIHDNAKRLYVAMCILHEYYDSEEGDVVSEFKKVGLGDISLSVVTKNTKHMKYQVPSGALDTYGIIEKKIEFEDANTPDELYDRAMDYLYAAQFNDMELSVSAIDLELLVPSMPLEEVTSLMVGESIRVVSWPHGLNRYFSISQISVTLDDAASMKFSLGYSNTDSLAKLFDKKRKD